MNALQLFVRHAPADRPKGGLAVRRVRWAIHLTRAGAFERLEPLGDDFTCLVPSLTHGSGINPSTAIDNFIYGIGVGKPGSWDRAARSHAGYCDDLAKLDHPAARIVLRFLRGPRPLFLPVGDLTQEQRDLLISTEPVEADLPAIPPPLVKRGQMQADLIGAYACVVKGAQEAREQVGKSSGEIVCFDGGPSDLFLWRVEGEGDWWLDPAVVSAHVEKTDGAAISKNRGQCSLCLQDDQPIVKLLRPTPKLQNALLVSFNKQAWRAYGRSQSENASICPACADAMCAGLDTLLEGAWATTYGEKQQRNYALWFPDDPASAASTWEAVAKILARDTPAEEREALLAQLPEVSHYVSLSRMQKRAAMRRYNHVDGNLLRERLRRWLDIVHAPVVGNPAYWVPRALSPDRPVPTHEDLLNHLIGGEPIPARVLQDAKREYQKKRTPFLASFLFYVTNEQENDMDVDKLTPREQAMVCLGQIFARAEYLQCKERRPNRTLSQRMPNAGVNPARALAAADRFSTFRWKGKTYRDKRMGQLTGHLLLDLGLPARPTPHEQTFFQAGMALERRWIEARAQEYEAERARKAEEAESKTDKTDDDNTASNQETN